MLPNSGKRRAATSVSHSRFLHNPELLINVDYLKISRTMVTRAFLVIPYLIEFQLFAKLFEFLQRQKGSGVTGLDSRLQNCFS